MLREIQWFLLSVCCFAGSLRYNFSDEPSQAPPKVEFSPSVPISEVEKLGNRSAAAAAQTLFWYFNAAQNGTDDVTLIKAVRGMLLFQSREDLNGWMQGDSNTARLYGLLIENPDQISGVQFSPPETPGRSSDQVVRVRINYRDGSTWIKTIAFMHTPLEGGGRWSARINIHKDAGGNLTASFAPIMQLSPR